MGEADVGGISKPEFQVFAIPMCSEFGIGEGGGKVERNVEHGDPHRVTSAPAGKFKGELGGINTTKCVESLGVEDKTLKNRVRKSN